MFSKRIKCLILILFIPTIGLGIVPAFNNEKIEAQTPETGNSEPRPAMPSSNAKVVFERPLPVESLVKIRDERNVKLQQLDSELVVGGEPIYGIYSLNSSSNLPSSTTGLESYIKEERLAYFADMVAGEKNLSAEERSELKPQLDAMKVALKKQDPGLIRITQATFSGESSQLQRLKQDSNVEEVEVEDEESIKQNNRNLEEFSERNSFKHTKYFPKLLHLVASLNPVLLIAQKRATWYPNFGRSETGKSTIGKNQRYTKQYQQWNANIFKFNETYEHEFYLDATDGNKTYLTTSQTFWPNCMPNITSAQSTWGSKAKPYLDTRLEQPGHGFCEAGSIGYVIGAANAGAIKPNYWHHTYIKTAIGNASTDRFKVTGQRGYRKPNACFTTWCSFGYKNYPKAVFLPSWSTPVPGVKIWKKP